MNYSCEELSSSRYAGKNWFRCLPLELIFMVFHNLSFCPGDLMAISSLSHWIRELVVENAGLWSNIRLTSDMRMDFINMVIKRCKDRDFDVVIDERDSFQLHGERLFEACLGNMSAICTLFRYCGRWRSVEFNIRSETEVAIREVYGSEIMTKLLTMKIGNIYGSYHQVPFYGYCKFPILQDLSDGESRCQIFRPIDAPMTITCCFALSVEQLSVLASFLNKSRHLRELTVKLYSKHATGFAEEGSIVMPWLKELTIVFLDATEGGLSVITGVFDTKNLDRLTIVFNLGDGRNRMSSVDDCKEWMRNMKKQFGSLTYFSLHMGSDQIEVETRDDHVGDAGTNCRLYFVEDIFYYLPELVRRVDLSISYIPLYACREDAQGNARVLASPAFMDVVVSACDMVEEGFKGKVEREFGLLLERRRSLEL